MILLKDFIKVANVIEKYLCRVYVYEYDENFEDYFPKLVKFDGYTEIQDMRALDNFMDYEVVQFNQELHWGELDCQELYLKKVEDENDNRWAINWKVKKIRPK